jgi:hypothetical protein
MKHETAGDPMSGLKWTRRTTDKIAAELQSFGIQVSDRTPLSCAGDNILRPLRQSFCEYVCI